MAQPGVYDLYERGMWHRYRDTRDALEKAEALFREVLEIDPTYAHATTALSLCRNFAAISRWVPDIASAHAEPLMLARRAVTDAPRDPHAHFALGVACMNTERRPEAMDELREAIRLNPSHALAYANLGQVFNYLNRPEEALPQIELALRLNPHDPRRFMWSPYLAASHYLGTRSASVVRLPCPAPHSASVSSAISRCAAKPIISRSRLASEDFSRSSRRSCHRSSWCVPGSELRLATQFYPGASR